MMWVKYATIVVGDDKLTQKLREQRSPFPVVIKTRTRGGR